MVEFTAELHPRAEQRLRRERIIWLTSVRADGEPQPAPVWFVWDGETILIYSRSGDRKVRNMRGNPRVALHLNSDEHGGDIVRITGDAEIDEAPAPATEVGEYMSKYREGIARIGMTPESYARAYSVAIQVRPRAFYAG